jgi:hypothetical protein
MPKRFLILAVFLIVSGCALIPDVTHQPQFHNPFPQLHRVAVLPFFNQSEHPHLDGDAVARHYIHELQQIPGFEVVPLGVTQQFIASSGITGTQRDDFRKLAQFMEVDAVVVGSVTEYDPYYPPKIGLAVDWYAANPAFHPIPPGYGLPWGTPEEEFIPDELVQEAEFALARAQLRTQTPGHKRGISEDVGLPSMEMPDAGTASTEGAIQPTDHIEPLPDETEAPAPTDNIASTDVTGPEALPPPLPMDLPPNWPDPRGFVPPPPSAVTPPEMPYDGPVITHVRNYDGTDGDFTAALANYYYYRDDARAGDWQGYLKRSDDFIRFCCYQHITGMLTSRGGGGQTRVVWRWPFGRYDR